jgi:hypothetical protein
MTDHMEKTEESPIYDGSDNIVISYSAENPEHPEWFI